VISVYRHSSTLENPGSLVKRLRSPRRGDCSDHHCSASQGTRSHPLGQSFVL
jgi:hypothetical protein